MGSKYCKRIPEFVYFVEEGEWQAGPFVKLQKGRINRKFKLVEEIKKEELKSWVCNECNFPNFSQSVPASEIEQELHSCINCGSFEFHLENRN